MSTFFRITQEADGVHMIEGPASNWVVLSDGADFTLIDGGYPSDVDLVIGSIKKLGLDPKNAHAMLITHGHVDHTGAANHLAEEYGTPILSSPEEHGQMLGTERYQVAPMSIIMRAWKPAVFSWMMHVIRSGGAKGTEVPTAKIWDREMISKLPGAPVAIATPGHTPGHTVFHLPGSGLLISGDALITGHAISRKEGPQMLHPMFHHDLDQAYSTLGTLEGLMAQTIIPGHGKAFRGCITEMAKTIRKSKP